MKKLLPFLITLFCLNVSAQVDSIPNPPGYTNLQLSTKNILRVSPDDHIWIGFKSIGAAEYDGTSWRIYNNTNGMPSNNVAAFAFDGIIKWIGTDSGLVKTDGVNLLSFNIFNSPLPSNKINYLFKENSALWIATDKGIISYDGTNWNIYNTSNSQLTSDTILSINKNNSGVYVSATTGIFLFRNNIWKYVGVENDPVLRITYDKYNHLFTGLNQIVDTVLVPVSFQSDPCYFNLLVTHPNYIIGGNINNNAYSVISVNLPPPPFYVIKFDSLLNIERTYLEDSFPIIQALNIDYYSCQLFDFNNAGEIISTKSFNGPTRIYKTSFTGINQLQHPVICPYLDINQVSARIWNNGSMFWDLIGHPLYEVPKGSAKPTIFAEGFWIGGRDSQDKLHIAAQMYRQGGSDFWPGPLDTVNATIDPPTFQLYDKLWKIDRYTINDFIFNYQNGSVTNGTYTIPDIILNWPAHGTGNITRSLAPFVDNNLDGIYNPLDGDYPKIKGDQMLWWVFNDNYSSHGETNSPSNLGVEIHGSAYAYNCPQLISGDSVVNYTTFYHYDIINRSDTDYHDVYTGIYDDIDLGNYLDDYVGCDTINDIAFAYNGDDDDDGSLGYGLHPPMINLAFLNGPEASPNDAIDNNHNGTIDEPGENCLMNHFIYFNNDFTAIGNPTTATHYYWMMQGIWKDSTILTYGGTGYNPTSTNYTNYMFPGPQYDTLNGWSEGHPCTGCAPNSPSDRRFLISSGPFDLPPHGQRSLDYAYVYTREPHFPNGPNTSLTVNLDQVMRIKNFFQTDSFPCSHLIGIDELKKENLSISLYPNPAHAEIFVSIANEQQGNKMYYITDITGKEIFKSGKFSSPSFRVDLSRLTSGMYLLHLQTKDKSCVRKFVVE